MSNHVFKNQVYAGILEILKDKHLYHNSIVGPQFSHLTEDGVKEIADFINLVAPRIIKNNEQELENLAKQIVWKELEK